MQNNQCPDDNRDVYYSHGLQEKSSEKLHMQVALMPNVTSKLSKTKVHRCAIHLATKGSIKSVIKFAL